MSLDSITFFKRFNPNKTLTFSDGSDRRYYINFTPARSSKHTTVSLIDELYRTITLSDDQSHQLFTGHIGCGKSTELRKLQNDLEQVGFHVVYLDSTEDLVMTDVDISDVLLTIARQVSKSLKDTDINLELTGFQRILQKAWNVLQSEVALVGEGMIPGVVEVSFKSQETTNDGLAKLSTILRNIPSARSRLRQYLEPQTDNLITLLNQELLEPTNKALQAQGKQGLVVIVDSLDRVENTKERNQAEYLFVTRGEKLRQFHCHVVYTLPLVLTFSNSIGPLRDRFGSDPKVLPMVRIQSRTGVLYEDGIALLRQMILARAFPDLPHEQRLQYLTEVFDVSETCDRLCTISGGHIRSLLVLLYGCLQRRDPPIDRDTLEDTIAIQRDSLVRAINTEEWALLHQVKAQNAVVGEESYQALLRSLFIFEYRDEDGTWFGLNPILAEAKQLQG
jgi:hypothetical protein